jgi:HD-GYP domain-containing protein (c-di-GMP phosphodiesterase class II)
MMLLPFLNRRRHTTDRVDDSGRSIGTTPPRALVFDPMEEQVRGSMHDIMELTVQLGRAMGVPESELKNLRLGAFLHDIGMIGIPDDVLFKSGSLTPDERAIIRRHPTYAYELLSAAPTLSAALDIPYCHHEKWDGTGYPRGLRGDEIPLAARIFAVADVWVALTSERPYRPAWPTDDAEVYIVQRSGREFDPAVVNAFVRVRSDLES